jgi:hypothetical protein
MHGPGPWLAAAICLAAAGGCFGPAYEDCAVACTSSDDCAPGQACGAAGMCTASDDPMACTGGGSATPDAPSPSPAMPAGTYNLVLTNQENGCSFPDWDASATANVSMKISQMAMTQSYLAEMQGNAGMIIKSWLGTNVFTGPLVVNRLDLVLMSTKITSMNGCLYTFDVEMDATLTGEVLDGTLVYRSRTNGASGCGVLNNCTSRQALRGARIPH